MGDKANTLIIVPVGNIIHVIKKDLEVLQGNNDPVGVIWDRLVGGMSTGGGGAPAKAQKGGCLPEQALGFLGC